MNKLLVLCATCLSLGVVRAEASAKSEVVVMATGGTIAGASAAKSAVTGYTSGVIGADALVNAIPEISQIANVRSRQVFQMASENLMLDQVFALADAVRIERCDVRLWGCSSRKCRLRVARVRLQAGDARPAVCRSRGQGMRKVNLRLLL